MDNIEQAKQVLRSQAMAESFGIDTSRYKLIVFVLAAACLPVPSGCARRVVRKSARAAPVWETSRARTISSGVPWATMRPPPSPPACAGARSPRR